MVVFTTQPLPSWRALLFESAKNIVRYLFLNGCSDALASGIKQLCVVGSTKLADIQGLLGLFPHKITNGPLEGLNKIKTRKCQAYSFRGMEYFKLRLYSQHNSSPHIASKSGRTTDEHG